MPQIRVRAITLYYHVGCEKYFTENWHIQKLRVNAKFTQYMHEAVTYHKIMRNFPKIIRKVRKIRQKFPDKKRSLAILHAIYALGDKG